MTCFFSDYINAYLYYIGVLISEKYIEWDIWFTIFLFTIEIPRLHCPLGEHDEYSVWYNHDRHEYDENILPLAVICL